MDFDMEADMMSVDWFKDKVCAEKSYAQNLYAALCNNDFQKQDVWEVLVNKTWSCSWRYAGGCVARLRNEGDYMDWYCSGMGGVVDHDTDPDEWHKRTGYVPEGQVTDEIRQDLLRLGWAVVTNVK